ncbi:MAG: alkylphosphonate utilization protein [Pseudorhodobacter sp.]
MRPRLPDLRLTGARVLRDAGFCSRPLHIVGGRLAGGDDGCLDGVMPVDLSGHVVLPGIIDLHGPAPESRTHRSGRAGAAVAGLAEVDRAAAAHGVTTCHLAQGWSWKGGPLGPDAAERAMQAVAARQAIALIDLRVKPCVEIRLLGQDVRLLAAMARHGSRYAVLQDSLDPSLALHRLQPMAFARQAEHLGLSAEEMLARMAGVHATSHAVPGNLRALANGFDQAGVRFGSLGDPDAETREYHAMIGARITEFPASRSVAMAARSAGDAVLLSATEVLRCDDGLASVLARDLLAAGADLALASAGALPDLALAVFRLADGGWCDLATAWAAISSNPARILHLTDRGRISPGLRADLVVLHEGTRRIAAVICDGRLVHARPALRHRLLDLPAPRIAAQ